MKGDITWETMDIEGCFPNMPKEPVQLGLRDQINALKRKGYEGVSPWPNSLSLRTEANRCGRCGCCLPWSRACGKHATGRRHAGARCASAGANISDELRCCRGAPTSIGQRVVAAGVAVVGGAGARSTRQERDRGSLATRCDVCGPLFAKSAACCAHFFRVSSVLACRRSLFCSVELQFAVLLRRTMATILSYGFAMARQWPTHVCEVAIPHFTVRVSCTAER